MTPRYILDFHVGNPWTAAHRDVFETACGSAWANPVHPASEGARARVWLDAARATVASLTGYPHVSFHPDRNAAFDAWRRSVDSHVAAPATHRRHVLANVDSVLPVDALGQLASAHAAPWLVVQGANEETGVVDRASGQHVLLDAGATLGRVPLSPDADAVVADTRACGSPIDIGILCSRTPLPADGAVQVPLVVVAVDALARAQSAMPRRSALESAALLAFEARVTAGLADVQVHGGDRVGHIRSLSVLHLDGESLMRALDARGYVVGSGSACVQDGTPSHVLAAMGSITHGNVRIALPVDCDLAVIPAFADALIDTVRELRVRAGVDDL